MDSEKEPRKLEFSNLQEIETEARRLHSVGYEQLGKWNLAQICGHLEDWMRFPVEGNPKPGFPMGLILWTLKKTLGKSMIRKILDQRQMKKNTPTMPQTVKSPDEEMVENALNGLSDAIKQFKDHQGEYHESLVFGKLSREDATQLQLIHGAHHLAYLVPKENRA